jgi:hypothetical protein
MRQEALPLFRATGDQFWTAETIASLGRGARQRADFERARALAEESLALQREWGNPIGIAISLNGLAELAAAEGDAARAVALFREALPMYAEHGSHFGIHHSLLGIGQLAGWGGRPEAAARILGAAEALGQARGMVMAGDLRGPHDRCVARIRADLGAEAFAVAWAAGRALPLEQAVAEALAATEELGREGG